MFVSTSAYDAGAVIGVVSGCGLVVAGLFEPEFIPVCFPVGSSFVLTSRETVEPPWVDDRLCFLDQLSVEDGRVGGLGNSGWDMSLSRVRTGGWCSLSGGGRLRPAM